MPPTEATLQAVLTDLASRSNGRFTFRVRTVRELGAELGLELGRSPNPIYDFEVSPGSGASFRSIAYTLSLNAASRPATRVEALGRGLAAGGGRLFDFNPFLLIFDYAGNQFMAVSAVELFGAFAREVAQRPLAAAETATFSLTPNFTRRTVSLYASVPDASIWYSTLDLEPQAVEEGLIRIRDETVTNRSAVPEIVTAIQSRIEGTAASPVATVMATPPATVPVPETPEADVRIPARVWDMVLRAIRSSPAVILVGPPGTGKTALLRKAIRSIANDPASVGQVELLADPLWATPDESWTARELIGGETISDGAIQFRPGWILRALAENRWLILDEANRADMDRIFGGLLTWLSGGTVTLGAVSTAQAAPVIELGWNTGASECATVGIEDGEMVGASGKVRYLAGSSWRLLGTYNALDAQRVFRFGAALGRRFVRVPIPAVDPTLFAEALAEQAADLATTSREGILKLYVAHYESNTTQLGPALFLAMCRYLRAAAAEMAETPPLQNGEVSEAPPHPSLPTIPADHSAQALAEAYVVHIGTWLAHLEVRDFDELKKRVLLSGALTESDWSWISTMILALA